MIHDVKRLDELFNKPALAPLLNRLRSRVRLGRDLHAVVELSNLSLEERSAVHRLLGRRPSVGASIGVRPQDIERVLREGRICDSLEEALTHLFGPIANEREARESVRKRWAEIRASCVPEFSDLQAYHPWLDRAFSIGRIKRWCGGDPTTAQHLLRHLSHALHGVPWPIISLADLATRLTGDSHALDRGTPLSRLCLSAMESQHPLGEKAPSRRQLWEWAGVVIDELSAPVLVLNLRADPATLIGQMLNPMADAGEPCHLSVRLLRSASAEAFAGTTGQVVYACENPSVVAATAQQLGRRSAPLICTAGQPGSAAQLLLTRLRQAGRHVRYHGDFDYAGIRIVNLLIQRFGVAPWRMTTTDYASADAGRLPLTGAPVTSIWDPDLTPQLNARGAALLEESVLADLLDDLSQTTPAQT